MEKNREIKINVSPEFKDFLRVLFWQTFKKFWFIGLIALILIPVFLFGVYSVINGGKFSAMTVMPLAPLFVVCLMLYGIYSAAKKAAASVKGTTQWVFSETGVETFSPIGTSEFDWSGVEKISETADEFLWFPQKSFFIVIPKRNFEAESEIQEFKELIADKLGDKAKLKK